MIHHEFLGSMKLAQRRHQTKVLKLQRSFDKFDFIYLEQGKYTSINIFP